MAKNDVYEFKKCHTCVYLCLFHNPLKEKLFNSWTVAQIEPQKLKKTYQIALDCVSISVTGSGRLSLPSYTFVVKIINNVRIGCVYISCCQVLFSTPCSRNKTKIIFYQKYYFQPSHTTQRHPWKCRYVWKWLRRPSHTQPKVIFSVATFL